MSKITIDQKTIKELFSDKKADFLIPDYQRPYAWGENECQTLWDDLFTFAFPENEYGDFDPEKFNTDDEYYLGPIVTFKNATTGQLEIIDGQQRLTTLMLLLRAFYSKFGKMSGTNIRKIKESIEQCIWKVDEDEEVIPDELKISSDVATDNDKAEFLDILKSGEAKPSFKSIYAKNFRFFQNQIDNYKDDYADYFSKLPKRILDNCILLPIEAESQDTALRIFSTLNDRGKPLSDADIFKSQFYKYFSSIGKKDYFIDQWKQLEEKCDNLFHPIAGTPMDDLFTRYMYYERAKLGIKSSTTEALRKFYEKNSYSLLRKKETLDNLIDLANFWYDVDIQNTERFCDEVLRNLFVLNYAPNGMWTYFVSVYYMQNRRTDGSLDNEQFKKFLSKIIAFIWEYAIVRPGVNALRTPVFAEMVNIVNGQEVTFKDFLFEESHIKSSIENYQFNNNRAITKSMLTWWAFQKKEQELIGLDTVLETEHIFAKNRQDKEHSLTDTKNLECLGNKALLEKRINIRASDYRFEDKKKYYQGYKTEKGQEKEGSKIFELVSLAKKHDDFNEKDIIVRNTSIIDGFINYLKDNGLLS